jgi:excisionase family DNA binding protein
MPMTKQEVADFLSVSTRAVESYAAKGRLSVTYTKGKRGQIAVFDDGEVKRLKDELAQPAYPQRPGVSSPEQPHTQAIVPFGRSGLVPIGAGEGASVLEAYRRFVPVADKLLLKLDEASALTGLSRGILRQAIEDKKLKARIIGKGWRVKRDDLDAYVRKL